jgi:hypothetical protein
MLQVSVRSRRRAAALVLAALAAGLVYGALVRPIIDWHRRYDERFSSTSLRLAQMRRVAAEGAQTRKLIEERRRANPAKHLYLQERNAALAAAELQDLIKRAVTGGRGELISTQVVPRESAREITVKVRLRGTVSTLQRTLHELEGDFPMLFVDHLSVDSATGDLVIGFDVTGYTRESAG